VIKHTVEVSQEPAYLTVRLGQLVLKNGDRILGSLPCEDVGVVVVDNPGTTYSHAALATLARSDAVLVICGHDHLPAAVLLPLADHSQITWRIAEQVGVSRPRRKRLWKQLVQAKIRAQAANVPTDWPAHAKLLDLARQVRSGDPSNLEAQAARIYWDNWLPEIGFRRNPDLGGLNALLNYGYAIVRAAVARALIAAGLLPALGLFHSNRANAFCLADDLIEPLRPLVDDRARELFRQGYEQLNQETKARLLEILQEPVRIARRRGPLMVSLHRMVASLVRCYQGEDRRLEIPKACI
jgi:CRISPR-associated protein Cas1